MVLTDYLDTLSPIEDAVLWTTTLFDTWKLENQYYYEWQSTFLLDQTMTIYIWSPL